MKKIQKVLLAAALLVGFAATPLLAPVGVSAQPADEIQSGIDDITPSGGGGDLAGSLETVVNILLFIIGAVSVIMLVIGGFRYVLSGGDQNAVTSAKNTILYAIIGVVVALLAYAIVNFVLDQFIGGSSGSGSGSGGQQAV
jgi:hypothetical protein